VTATFRGIAADEFPVVPSPEDGDDLAVEAGDLRKGLEQVTFAASMDDSHAVLNGVLAEFEGETLKLVAADGFASLCAMCRWSIRFLILSMLSSRRAHFRS
jgi:DNA polymerase III sliding clamp (beta) subunit (PCNA family)